MTSQILVSIISSHEVVKELKEYEDDQIRMTDPVKIDSPADVLDAPLTPDQVREIVELVKVVIETGAAALTFYAALMTVIRSRKASAVIKDAKTGETKGVIDPETSDQEAKQLLGL